MTYYFIASKKKGFACVNYSFFEPCSVGNSLFDNQGLNGFDYLQVFSVFRNGLGKTFNVYLFNEFVFPPVEELRKAISTFFGIPVEEVILCFIQKEVKHD